MADTFAVIKASAYAAGDKWGYQTAEKVRQDFNVLAEVGGCFSFHCGGQGVESASFVEVPFSEDYLFDADAMGGMTCEMTYYSWTSNASTSVQMRLRNTTDSSTIDTNTSHSSTSKTREVRNVTLTASGAKRYRLEITGGNADNAVFGFGYLRIYKA